MSIGFEGRVAIVTGAGNGLGRAHALGLAARGAKVVVNDLGGTRDGTGQSSQAARDVAAEIVAAGGQALANGANVADPQAVRAMVEDAMTAWGRVDILVNNAGILRDKTFSKMELEDFRAVIEVHLMGSVICAKAVWDIMKAQNYGRIVFTSSSSGLYGNFGQANYAAAKMAMIGLMNVLHLEGERHNIKVNALAPTAATRMTEELLPQAALELLTPDSITPGLLCLVGEDAPSRAIMAAGAGVFARAAITESQGVYFPELERSPENIAAQFAAMATLEDQKPLPGAFAQTQKFVVAAAKAKGVKL